jgi:hypothetical protein
MSEIVFTILIAAVIYWLPGYLVLQLVDLQGASRTIRFCLAVCLSLIIVPSLFLAVSNVISFIPGAIPWFILVVILIAIAWLLKRTHRLLPVRFGTTGGEPLNAKWTEQVGAIGWIAIFSLVALLPRLDMFFFGGSTHIMGTWDETWHLAQLVSVARSGLPPQHYLFPTISLSYYYGSWIYPAILGNLPWLEVSLARAMALHAYIQTFAFLGLVYCLLLANYKRWWVRLAGLGFFTLIGGFDFYASMASSNTADWWQGSVGWLISGFQASQFVTLYAWVPQHLAGGMAFLMGWLVWKNLNCPVPVKIVLTSLMLAFCLTTSPFVFLFFGMSILLMIALNLKGFMSAFNQARKEYLISATLGVIIFLFITGRMLVGFSGRTSIGLSDFRVPIFESMIGPNHWSVPFDRLFTILGFPLVASWIGLIEFGLPFIFYVGWILQRVTSGKGFPNRLEALMATLPPLSFLLVMTLHDVGGGGNFTMRGLIPAQILIQFGALTWLETANWTAGRWKRVAAGYLVACFVVAQGSSALAQVQVDSMAVFTQTIQRLEGRPSVATDNPFQYVSWLNIHTTRNALVLEAGCMTTDDSAAYRWLERSRFIMPACGKQMALFDRDQDFYRPNEGRELKAAAVDKTDILELYQASAFRLKGKVPVYLVDWGNDPHWDGVGEMVYQDEFVGIIKLP